ncbi:MAG: hypothetical protein VKO21_05385 [Candidatus Sericytochromatia bacterium]|nr:hypothetical protein [Candidatus Sericytochromatia bacterium]
MIARRSFLHSSLVVLLAGCVQPTTKVPPPATFGTSGGATPVPSPGQTQSPGQVLPFTLSDSEAQALGYLKRSPGQLLKGIVSGPETLVANGAAGLIANGAANLIANGAAGLIANGAANLIANGAAGLTTSPRRTADRTGRADFPVTEGWVALSTPAGQLLARPDGQPYGGVTNASGSFEIAAPAEQMVVTVLLKGNRRLSALVDHTKGSGEVPVDLATTLVTEYLRQRLRIWGLDLSVVFEADGNLALYKDLVTRTGALLRESDYAGLEAADLALEATDVLNDKYALAVGRAETGALAKAWADLLRAIAKDKAGDEDVGLQPMALESSALEAPDSETSRVVAYDPVSGRAYLNSYGYATETLTLLDRDASTPRILARRYNYGANGFYNMQAVTPFGDGGLLLGAVFGDLVDSDFFPVPGLAKVDTFTGFDPSSPVFNPWRTAEWQGARFILPAADASGDLDLSSSLGWSIADLAVDPFTTEGTRTVYAADADQGLIQIVTLDGQGEVVGRADPLGKAFEDPAERDEAAAALGLSGNMADLAFMYPTNVTVHVREGKRYLFVTDTEAGVIFEIDLAAGTWKRLAGIPVPAERAQREARRHLTLDASSSLPVDEGKPAVEVPLNYPHKVVVDDKQRLFIADSDHQLIRMVRLDDPQRRIWTVAGNMLETVVSEKPALRDRLSRYLTRRSVRVQDGDAKSVTLGEINSIAIDAAGNLLMTDDRSRRVRVLRIGNR